MVTLFHWDLPVWAAEFGGWDSEEVVSAFEEYTKVVVGGLSDKVRCLLTELEKAIDEGVPVFGYLHWSLLDNFEWTHGFDIRFGLVYVDYKTQKRTIKDSALFYANVIKTNGGCLMEGFQCVTKRKGENHYEQWQQ
jgi:beta-glucosidase/6-phospho-beta-glucosidase/beta-galactosidase